MRIAIFSDVHANLEAFLAVLSDISTRGCDLRFCLGDTVGYGANPSECVALLKANSIPSLKGNHDEAAGVDIPLGLFNPQAAAAIQWTRNALKREERDWLLELPYQMSLPEHRMTLYHANGFEPEGWEYVCRKTDASLMLTLREQKTPLVFIGHTHAAAAYAAKPSGKPQDIVGNSFRLQDGTRYVINVGSIGQPRDKNPKACYVIYDTAAKTINFIRLDYPIARAQDKIIAAKFPERLAKRLSTGT